MFQPGSSALLGSLPAPLPVFKQVIICFSWWTPMSWLGLGQFCMEIIQLQIFQSHSTLNPSPTSRTLPGTTFTRQMPVQSDSTLSALWTRPQSLPLHPSQGRTQRYCFSLSGCWKKVMSFLKNNINLLLLRCNYQRASCKEVQFLEISHLRTFVFTTIQNKT